MEAPERVFIEFEEYDGEFYINDINYDECSTESAVEYIRADIAQKRTLAVIKDIMGGS